MWYPLYFIRRAMECHGYYVEKAFHVCIGQCFSPVEESVCGFCQSFLFCRIHVVLRRSLYAFLAGLHLYKMYSFRIECYDIDFKMSAAPVPFQYCMAMLLKPFAGQIFSESA